MKLKYFGDSFDIVKKSLLHWLAPLGPWAVHPMFTHPVTTDEAVMFSQFVGAPLVSTEVLSIGTDRRAYLAECGDCRSLFLDPDTGVRVRRPRQRHPEFVFGDELVQIVTLKFDGVVLVYDQSLARGREREQLSEKLAYFRDAGIAGFAYVSHASFFVLARSTGVIQQAKATLLETSRLPHSRILDM